MKKILLAGALALAGLATALPASAQVGLYVRVGPPAPRYERIPPAPGPGFVWVGGYYDWAGGRYVWRPGRYLRRPYPGAVWVHPRWDGYHHRYIRGYWRH